MFSCCRQNQKNEKQQKTETKALFGPRSLKEFAVQSELKCSIIMEELKEEN